jgi:hypothetical protein
MCATSSPAILIPIFAWVGGLEVRYLLELERISEYPSRPSCLAGRANGLAAAPLRLGALKRSQAILLNPRPLITGCPAGGSAGARR